MFYFNEIPPEDTDIIRRKNSDDGKASKYSIIHEYISDVMINRLNESLRNAHETIEGIPLVELIYEKHTTLSDMTDTKNIYMYDFKVRMANRFETKESHGYRIRINARDGQIGRIGVRVPSEKNAWHGEDIHRSGLAPFISDYSISVTNIQPTRSPFASGSASQRVWGIFSYILTETAFLLFVRRARYSMNIISFISCEDVLKERNFMWLSNGWRDNYPNMDIKSRQDIFVAQTARASPNGKMWLLDYFIQDAASRDVRWFMPDIYITHEHRMNNHTEYIIKHNNLSVGMTEDNQVFCCLLNTLPVRTTRIMAVL